MALVLLILKAFSIFYCNARKLKLCQNLRGPFTLCLDCDGSEVVDFSFVANDRNIQVVSFKFDMTYRCCVWKLVLCWFGAFGHFAWSKLMCCFNAGFSSSKVSCEVCKLTRLWLLCWADPLALVRLSCLGSRSTHPRRSPSSVRSWSLSSTLPIWEQ